MGDNSVEITEIYAHHIYSSIFINIYYRYQTLIARTVYCAHLKYQQY